MIEIKNRNINKIDISSKILGSKSMFKNSQHIKFIMIVELEHYIKSLNNNDLFHNRQIILF